MPQAYRKKVQRELRAKMMDETRKNADLHTMVALGAIGQDDAEAQYPKIQKLAVEWGVSELQVMGIIAYLTVRGYAFLEALAMIMLFWRDANVTKLLNEIIVSDHYLQFANDFIAYRNGVKNSMPLKLEDAIAFVSGLAVVEFNMAKDK